MSGENTSADGRVVLISGANRGIGRAIAEALHDRGYCLSLGARDPDSLVPVLAEMDAERVMGHGFQARDPTSGTAWVAATAERFGRIDALVNNAGVAHHFTVDDPDEAKLDEMWEVNVKAPLRLIRAAWPHLQQAGSGRVVNVVSLSGKRVKSAEIGGYAMTKHAAFALTHAVRHKGWDDGIRATSICPGLVATDMTAEVTTVPREEMIQPAAIAQLVATVLTLPNTAAVAEIPINCVLEPAV
jgi:NADP-dependent 3-hydroxy acid dehydrogenase YdfG